MIKELLRIVAGTLVSILVLAAAIVLCTLAALQLAGALP